MQALIDSGEQGFGSSSEGQMMEFIRIKDDENLSFCLLYTSPSPRD